ncbi:hypothetical protein Ancab_023960 [Ancistrocladus abbreviatus]
MGRSPCCEKEHTNKGAWTKEEDERLISYIKAHGEGSWRSLPKAAGLQRCGKSCRLRWINYLRPDLKRGNFTEQEDDLIINLHSLLGNKWSLIAARLPGRTDNEIKNYWNTHIKKKLLSRGIDPQTHCALSASTTSISPNNTTCSNSTTNINFQLLDIQGSPMQFLSKTTDTKFNTIDMGSTMSEESNSNSNSTSVVTAEERQILSHNTTVNLELSISLPCSADERKPQQPQLLEEKFFMQMPAVRQGGEVCLCCHMGFKNGSRACHCLSIRTTVTANGVGVHDFCPNL